MRTSSYEVH